MNLLVRWIINALAITITAYILQRGVHVSNFIAALAAALVLGIINATIKPVLILLTLPITIFSLGLFVFVINALMILLSSAIVPGFYVENFWWALAFSMVLTIINFFLYQVFE